MYILFYCSFLQGNNLNCSCLLASALKILNKTNLNYLTGLCLYPDDKNTKTLNEVKSDGIDACGKSELEWRKSLIAVCSFSNTAADEVTVTGSVHLI